MLKKAIIASMAGLALTAPAIASENSTIDYVLEQGAIYNIMGIGYVVDFNEDGTYGATGMGAFYTGTWRRDGDTFCLHPQGDPETCSPYPEGQEPGGTFPLNTNLWGPITVQIRE